MLVHDNLGKVHRIDPVSGAYLGSFNANPWGGSVTTASYVNKRYYMIGPYSNSMSVYNYSTGDEVGNVGVTPSNIRAMTMSLDQSALLMAGQNGTIYRYDPNTLTRLSDFATSGADIQNIMVAPDGKVLTVEMAGGGHYFRSYSAGGSMLYSYQLDSTSGVFTPGMAIVNYQALAPGTAGSNGFFFANYSASGGQFAGGSTNSLASISKFTGMVAGHTGAYFVGPDTTTANGLLVQRVDMSAYYTYKFNYSNITGPTGVAIVLAPEPASFAVLALGGLALMRRRRQR